MRISMQKIFADSANIGELVSPAKNFPDFGKLVTVIVNNAFVLAGLLALVFIIIGGFAIISNAGGDPKQIENGKQTLTMAIVGLLVVIFATWIIQLLRIVLGFDPLRPPGL